MSVRLSDDLCSLPFLFHHFRQDSHSARRSAFSLVSSLHRRLPLRHRPRLLLLLRRESDKCGGNGSLDGWAASCLKDAVAENLKREELYEELTVRPSFLYSRKSETKSIFKSG